MIVGALIVLDEMKRARRRWREATRTWHEIEAVAVELRGEHTELPRHNAPDMVAAIRESVTEKLKNGAHGARANVATKFISPSRKSEPSDKPTVVSDRW
jgi:hypothetical protein